MFWGRNRGFLTVETFSLYVALSLRLGGELDEVQAELLRRVVESVLVDGLDALGREPQPHPSVALLPEQAPLLEVEVLHLDPHGKKKKKMSSENENKQKKARAAKRSNVETIFGKCSGTRGLGEKPIIAKIR